MRVRIEWESESVGGGVRRASARSGTSSRSDIVVCCRTNLFEVNSFTSRFVIFFASSLAAATAFPPLAGPSAAAAAAVWSVSPRAPSVGMGMVGDQSVMSLMLT